MPATAARFYRLSDMPKEKVTDGIERRIVSGEKAMLTQFYLKKGSVVPQHAHHHEQIAYVISGVIRLWVGEDGKEFHDVHAGEALVLPSNLPHKAEALEDVVINDMFSPPREDFLSGADSYFRKG